MKKLIFLLILSFSTFNSIAQNNFPAPQVVVGNTIFKVMNGEHYSQIYNAVNTSYLTNTNSSIDCGLVDIDITIIENAMRSVYVNSPHKLTALKNGVGSYKYINLFLVIKPNTGQVLQMAFDLPNNTIITPEELLQIENKIKVLSFPQNADCHTLDYMSEWLVLEW